MEQSSCHQISTGFFQPAGVCQTVIPPATHRVCTRLRQRTFENLLHPAHGSTSRYRYCEPARESEDDLRSDMSDSSAMNPATRNLYTLCYGYSPVQLAGTAIALSGLLLVACTGHSAKPSAPAEVRSEGATKLTPASGSTSRPSGSEWMSSMRAPSASPERTTTGLLLTTSRVRASRRLPHPALAKCGRRLCS